MKSLKAFSVCAVILFVFNAVPVEAQPADNNTLPKIYLPLVQSISHPPNDTQLQGEIAFRQSLGFSSSKDYVQTVHSAPNAVTLENVNATFTPDEAAEVLIRLDLEHDVEILQRYFTEHPEYEDALGGIYLDHMAGGKLVLQLVQSHPLKKVITEKLPPINHSDRLQINFVNWSNKHLQQQYEAIAAAFPKFPELEAVFTDQIANQVTVLINPVASTVSAAIEKHVLSTELAALVADPAVIIRAEVIELIKTAVAGGNSWNTTGSGFGGCTMAFEVTYSGGNGMVTAGHCMTGLASGTNVFWGTTHIGTVTGLRVAGSTVSYTDPDSIDAGVLKMDNASTATDNILPMSDIVGETSLYTVGLVRCMTGSKSGRVCGTITVSSANIQSSSTGLKYGDMLITSIVPQPGDSGAPISQDDGQFAFVTGVNLGQVNFNGVVQGLHSKWSRVKSRFGLSLVTTD